MFVIVCSITNLSDCHASGQICSAFYKHHGTLGIHNPTKCMPGSSFGTTRKNSLHRRLQTLLDDINGQGSCDIPICDVLMLENTSVE